MEAENDSECPDQSDKWTIAVDRGGLIHVSDLHICYGPPPPKRYQVRTYVACAYNTKVISS